MYEFSSMNFKHFSSVTFIAYYAYTMYLWLSMFTKCSHFECNLFAKFANIISLPKKWRFILSLNVGQFSFQFVNSINYLSFIDLPEGGRFGKEHRNSGIKKTVNSNYQKRKQNEKENLRRELKEKWRIKNN